MLFPTTPEAAQAEETGTKATLTINPVLSLGLDGVVTMSVQPTSTGEFTSGSAELTVSTNNETGYSLYLSTANGKATLDSINPATTTAVQPVSGTVAADGFGANTWGYNLSKDAATDSITYQAVPTTTTAPQATTASPTLGDGTLAADTYNLNFGALINSDLPSGTYTNTVTVSVVANPAYVPNLTQISNMQDMTTEICNASTVGQTNRLTDTRDGKLYWVAKLADNQCWMTQNLDFDIPADGLNNANGLAAKTDLPDGTAWDSSSGYAPQPTTTGSPFSNSSNTGTYSFDPGMHVNNDPTAWTYCNNYWNGGSCDNWTNVSNMSPMAEIRDESTSVVDTNSNTYDAHYLAGNYYQYTAATAGTGGSLNSYTDATGSICPKGWTLPSIRSSDYSHLTSVYSISSNSAGATALTKSPLYFIPAGYVRSGSLTDAGYHGYYWSSTVVSRTGAYNLYFSSDSVSPSLTSFRYGGLPVRCLAR